MTEAYSIVLVGVGGYGSMYCSAFSDPRFQNCRLIGAVDPYAASAPNVGLLHERNVPVVASIDELPDGPAADLAIIASPVQFHAEQTALLLKQGSHVLCEKPLCASLEQSVEMADARDQARRQVGIGYQWSFSNAIQSLKSDIQSGLLGAPKRFRTLVLWPRDEKYYKRNKWAGGQFDVCGRPVFDSPVNNAAAHYLHNMLYVLGDRPARSATPLTVTAELYRANNIENYDTAAIRCKMDGGVEILFITSHASTVYKGPSFVYEFEDAVVRFDMSRNAEVTVEFSNGSTKSYGSPEESHYQKIFAMLNVVKTGEAPVCGIEAALPQTQVMVAAQASSPIHPFDPSIVTLNGVEGRRRVHVEGLDPVLMECYAAGRLPSELKADWSIAGREVNIAPWRTTEPQLQHLNGHLQVAAATVATPATAFQFARSAQPAPQT